LIAKKGGEGEGNRLAQPAGHHEPEAA